MKISNKCTLFVLLVIAQTVSGRYVSVTNDFELQAAFDDAYPGDEIHITVKEPIFANRTAFEINRSGTAGLPIRIIQDFFSSGITGKY